MSLLPKVHVVLPVQYGIGHHQSLVPCSKVGMTLNFTQLKYVHYDTMYQESFLIYLPLFLEVYMPVITLRGIFRTKFIFLITYTFNYIHFHFYSSLMKGGESHKKLDLSANPVLRHYYHNRVSERITDLSKDHSFSNSRLDETILQTFKGLHVF